MRLDHFHLEMFRAYKQQNNCCTACGELSARYRSRSREVQRRLCVCAGWNLDSGLEIEGDPGWGVVARVFLPARPSVNPAVHEAV